jgi:hypothetical protein
MSLSTLVRLFSEHDALTIRRLNDTILAEHARACLHEAGMELPRASMLCRQLEADRAGALDAILDIRRAAIAALKGM